MNIKLIKKIKLVTYAAGYAVGYVINKMKLIGYAVGYVIGYVKGRILAAINKK